MNRFQTNIWKYLLAGINLIFGMFLWFDYLTAIQLAGKLTGFWYPLLIGVFAFTSYRVIRRGQTKKRFKWANFLVHFPSIAGGVCCLFTWIPPLMFITLIGINNRLLETRIEESISPDGTRVASIDHELIGIVDSDDCYSVRVHSNRFPLLEQELYYECYPDWDFEDEKLIQWMSPDTIQISGMPTTLSTRLKPSGLVTELFALNEAAP